MAVGPAVTSDDGAFSYTGSTGRAVAIQRDGKIVVAGTATDPSGSLQLGMLVERFTASGQLDASFGDGGVAKIFGDVNGQASAIAIQPDGRILVAGNAAAPDSNQPNGVPYARAAIARLMPNGGMDRSFARSGAETLQLGRLATINAIALSTRGTIVVAGSQRQNLQTTSALIARLLPNGNLDSGFAHPAGGIIRQYATGNGAYSAFNALAIRGDGEIYAAGTALAGQSAAPNALVVAFNSRGSQDRGFGRAGVALASGVGNYRGSVGVPQAATGLVLAPTGELIAAGSHLDSAQSSLEVWGFTPEGALDRFFGSGGTTVTAPSRFTPVAGNALAADRSGNLVVAGQTVIPGLPSDALLARFGAPPTVRAAGTRLSSSSSGIVRVTVGDFGGYAIRASAVLRSLSPIGGRIVTFASGRFSIRAHARGAVTLRIGASALRTLRRARRVSVALAISAVDSHHHRISGTQQMTLLAPGVRG
jgi:uncharacterized delta-60 repeat protein